MSAIMPEANSVEKCPTKSLGPKDSRKCLKNGLVNGLVLNNKHKMSSNHSSDIKELHNTEVVVLNHTEFSSEEVVNKVGKSKKNKKKKHKTALNKSEGVNGSKSEDISHRDNNDQVSSESLDNIAPDLISNDIEASASCSQSYNVDCETITSDIQKMLIKTEDIDIPQIENTIETCHKKIDFVPYESELQMPMIMKIIQKDLSEPYSIYTYRYFIHNWPKLCFLAMCEDQCVGAIVCKLDLHRKVVRRGYIAMLAVDQNYRKLKIGSTLVQMAIHEMTNGDADEVVLETEVTNKPALKLYEKLGFVRDKRLFRYYLNGVDALRLKLWLR